MSDYFSDEEITAIKRGLSTDYNKGYQQGMKDAIEKCAEFMAKYISRLECPCLECHLDCYECYEEDIYSCEKNLRLFLDNLIKGETHEEQQP